MNNDVFIAAVWAMIIAQWMKVPIFFFKTGKWDWSISISTGSMPSSHSAFVVSLATAIGITSGVNSEVFAVALVFALITIHDAIKVRGESGKQAKVLNQLVAELSDVYVALDIRNDKISRDVKLKELIGHTSTEVVGGIIVGIITAFVYINAGNLFIG